MPIPVTPDLLELAHRLLYRPKKFPDEGLTLEGAPSLLRELKSTEELKLPPPEILDYQAEAAAGRGMRILLSGESHWPEALSRLDQVPPMLFMLGEMPELERCVAVVGSRRCSRQGREMARLLGRGLAGAGITVVSGLARGIDGEAHLGALETGATLAVLGGGLDSVYPPEHRNLAGRIVEKGALLSEFPPGVTPLPYHFPRRNRIIAALADLTVVVEAGDKSGARSTAQHALDLEKYVGVVPGNPLNPAAMGSNQILFEGGEPVRNLQDVLDLLKWGSVPKIQEPWGPGRCRSEGVEDLESLALRSGWTLSRSIEMLESWERDGRVRRLGAGRFEVLG